MGTSKKKQAKLAKAEAEAARKAAAEAHEVASKAAENAVERVTRLAAAKIAEVEAAAEKHIAEVEKMLRDQITHTERLETEVDKLKRRLRAKSEEVEQARTAARNARADLPATKDLQARIDAARTVWREEATAHADKMTGPLLAALKARVPALDSEQQRVVLQTALEVFFGVSEGAFNAKTAKDVAETNEAAMKAREAAAVEVDAAARVNVESGS